MRIARRPCRAELEPAWLTCDKRFDGRPSHSLTDPVQSHAARHIPFLLNFHSDLSAYSLVLSDSDNLSPTPSSWARIASRPIVLLLDIDGWLSGLDQRPSRYLLARLVSIVNDVQLLEYLLTILIVVNFRAAQ